MKYFFHFMVGFFHIIISEVYSSEIQEQEPKKFYAYYKASPKTQEKDQVWRERFIVRLIRTKEDLNNKENFKEQGFKYASLETIAKCIDETKDVFSDLAKLTLVNFNYKALRMIKTTLRSLNPDFIECEYSDNVIVDQRVSELLTQLKKRKMRG